MGLKNQNGAVKSPVSPPYVSADMAMLMQPMPPERRAALEKLFAASHMAIPSVPED